MKPSDNSKVMRAYEQIALNYDLIPPDYMIMTLTGTSNSNVSQIRNRLGKQGYNFKPVLKVNGYHQKNGSGWWKVTKRPSGVEKLRQSVNDLSKEEAVELFNLIFDKVTSYKDNK